MRIGALVAGAKKFVIGVYMAQVQKILSITYTPVETVP
jgi:hypothetical protein